MADHGLDKAFELVGQLAHDFRKHSDHYLSRAYQEAEVRKGFIDKFFIALGWDVNHEVQSNPFEQEVKVEPPVATGGSQRRADYSFHVSPDFRDPRMIVEAKKPSVELDTADNYFQTIRYGWSKGNPIAGLTNFAQLHLLDCRYKPDIDKAIHRCERRYGIDDYLDRDKFREIYWLVSREAVAAGSLEKFAATLPKPRGGAKQRTLFAGGYQSVDESFLEDLDEYRLALARAFKSRNPDLNSETLTEVTQRTLDRLVFMRFLEDKLIEPSNFVANFGERGTAWQDFVTVSRRLNDTYNGIVFHQHSILDADDFEIDDSAFAGICEKLSHKNSPYDFNAIPIHILGSIYERFLGNIIVATDKRVRVEQKPEVRKAGGVYYTPEYIVRYIVASTVGRLIEGKSPDQIAEMHFADIACGSGSFLLGVYDLLLEYHTKFYNESPRKVKKGDCITKDGVLHLSLEKKREILLNNIFGVDIDQQAVEVTQLSLYLKLLDEETIASARGYQLRMHAAILPSLNKNIVRGNSLIGREEKEKNLLNKLDDDEAEKDVNPMNFEDAFPKVMRRGGFDAVVGNPPYVRQESLKEIKAYLKDHYQSFESTADLYVYFMEKGVRLLRDGGMLSFIVSSSFMRATYGEPLRRVLMDRAAVIRVIDFGGLPVFVNAKDTYVCIPLLARLPQGERVEIARVDTLEFTDLSVVVDKQLFSIPAERLSANAWMLKSDEEAAVFAKIMQQGTPLGDYIAGMMFTGIKTGFNEAFEIDGPMRQEFIRQCPGSDLLIRPFLGGQDIRRYFTRDTGRYLISIPAGWTSKSMVAGKSRRAAVSERAAWIWFAEAHPPLAEHLKHFERACRKRQDQGEFWWELRPCDYYDVLDRPKIIFPDICKGPRFMLDMSGRYLTNTAYCLGTDDRYLLGILNSRVFWFAISSISIPFGVRAGQFRYRLIYQYMEQVPIRAIDTTNTTDKARRDKIVRCVEQMIDIHPKLAAAKTDKDRNFYEAKRASLSRQIDATVYELYSLSEEDVRIVEEGGELSPD